MSDLHFLRPEFLALIPLILLIAVFIGQSTTASNWANYIAANKLKLLIKSASHQQRKGSVAFAIMGVIATLALAGPAWEQRPVPTSENISALVILFDLSPSMMAEDISPNRLTRAQLKITDLLRKREDGQTALIAYAGSAHRVSPLTDDSNTIEALIPALNPAVMPQSGSNVEAGVELAIELLDSAGFENNGHLLLVTDGITPDAQKNIRDLLPVGVKVSILGIGSVEGAPIPVSSGNFYRDSRGDIVLAKLNRNELQILAGLSSGRYIELQPDDSDLDYLLAHIDDPQASNTATDITTDNATNSSYDAWHDAGYLLIVLLLPFALMAFRRDVLFALPLLMVFPLPSPQAQADFWQDLWLTPDQQAQRLLEQGDAAAAAELFESPDWKAYSEFQAENYDASLDALQSSEDPSLYNLGTSLAMNGELEESLDAFNEFLESNPDHEDAIYNRDLVQLLLDQQEQEQQDQTQNGEEQQGENSDQQQSENGQEGQEGQEGQQQDQQEQEGSEQNNSQQANQGQSSEPQNGSEQSSTQQESASEQQPNEAEQASSGEASDEENENTDESEVETQETTQETALAEGEESNKDAEDGSQATLLADTPEEMSLASEQFLRGIPEDPSGFLRRKFEEESQFYQQQRRFVPPSVPGQSEEERY